MWLVVLKYCYKKLNFDDLKDPLQINQSCMS